MNYNEIIKFLTEEIGIDPESIGVKSIENSCHSLMKSSALSGPNDYLQIIKSDSTELEKLIAEITVPETWFFRDKEPFEYLKKFVKSEWNVNKQYKKLRILSAPCSNGEEPYSIAITLIEAGLSPDNFIIDAIDINQGAIDNAIRGAYSKSSFRSESSVIQAKYFKEDDNIFFLNEEIRNCVRFRKENLIKKGFLADNPKYNLIFCKNLLIYLGIDARKSVLTNIERLLEPDGILFVGHSEIIFFQQFGYKFIGHKHSFACRKSFDIQLKDTPKQKNITSEHLVKFRKDKINSEIKKSEKIINKNEENDLDILENVKRFANNGNFEQVELLMDLYQKKIKTNPKTYYLKGLICEAKNNTEQAEEWYNKALYLDPNNYESIVQLSLIYEKRGEDARAEIMKDRIKRLSINSDLKL